MLIRVSKRKENAGIIPELVKTSMVMEINEIILNFQCP
jgi:hypothetical protein